MLTPQEYNRYSRHLLLSQVGESGQEKLKQAKVLLVGLGGLGSPAALYLAAAGIGTLGIVDDGLVEESNLQRQILFDQDLLGESKAQAAATKLKKLNPLVHVKSSTERFSFENALSLLEQYDLVIDGTDNFGSRYLVNDACVETGKPFVSASVYQFEGQLSVFNLKQKTGEWGPTYRCLYPEPPSPGTSPSCSEIGVLGVLPGLFGTLQANEILKIVLGIGDPLVGRLFILNSLTMQSRVIGFTRNTEAVASSQLLSDEEYKAMNNGCELGSVKEISVQELKARMDSGDDIFLLDVREPFEREICQIGGELISMAELRERSHEIPTDQDVIVYCRSGARSYDAARFLINECGLTQVRNLAGGILQWATEIDPSLQKY